MKHLGDICKISGYDAPVVDIITGGSPCQDLSVAGKRAGLAGERSGLYMEQVRLVKEMREKDAGTGRSGWAVRPRYMVWENVPGAFSSGSPKGADFAAVIEELIKVAEPDAAVHVCVPDRGWSKSGCYYAEDGSWSIAWRLHDAQFWGVPQRRKRIALIADFGGLSASEILFERNGLSRDSEPGGAQGQGAADGAEGGADGAKSMHINGSDEVHAGEPIMVEMSSTKNTIITDGIGCTLTARMGTGGNQVNAVCASFYPKMKAESQCYRTDDIANTMPVITFDKEMYNCGEKMGGVPQARYDNVAPTVRADSHPSGVCTSTVRRLTPLECERLQGYPDGWTDIGEWTDSKGKRHKGADSPRYKALGNSIALPFWVWLARRICAQYERTPTMASLFDGIGGFPLVFSRAGAVPVWASEIEEFPMAVTKIHFPEVEE